MIALLIWSGSPRTQIPLTAVYDVPHTKDVMGVTKRRFLRPSLVTVNGRSDLEAAFAALHRERPDALFCSNNPLTLIFRKEIAEFAARERFPAVYPFAEVAEVGGLMSYGASRIDLFRRAASYVANILNGAKPGDMPIEQPKRFELVINLKTAKALGLAVPPTLLARADEVIE